MKRGHCVCELVQLTRRKQTVISHHLAAMRKKGL
ncbi:MAG: ArsR family transcriptional regulator [Candidatus Bathyarchaeia archaeon]